MRVQISIPDQSIFTYHMTVSKQHENSGGHLAHDKVPGSAAWVFPGVGWVKSAL